jgi:chromosome segregation ATPase
MDYKQLADDYREKLKTAHDRIFELESTLADGSIAYNDQRNEQEATQRRIAELENALTQAATQASGNTRIKAEEGVDTAPAPAAQTTAELTQRNRELETDLAEYSHWLTEVENTVGVSAKDVLPALRTWKEKIGTSSAIEKALRQQTSNHKKQAESAKEKVKQVEKDRDKALSDVQKFKAQAWRAKNLRCGTPLSTFGHILSLTQIVLALQRRLCQAVLHWLQPRLGCLRKSAGWTIMMTRRICR